MDVLRGALDDVMAAPTIPDFPGSAVSGLSASDAEFDDFFRLCRTTEPAAHALAAALWRTHLLLTSRPVGGHLDIDPADLQAGMTTLHRQPLPPAMASPDIVAWPTVARWRGGHQVFVAHTQAVIVGLRHARRHATAGDVAAAIAGLDVAVAFLRSSAAAMRVTGGFDPAEYRDRIRPLMTPPAVSDRFSGLMSVDHRSLVTELAAWGRVHHPPGTHPAHQRLREAVDHVYRQHIHVCERFVGTDAPSLLTAAAPATTVLRRLHQHRLNLL